MQKILIPAISKEVKAQFAKIHDLVQAELNVKEIELIDDSAQILTKTVKPDFKKLGPKLGGKIKFLKPALANLSQTEIATLENNGAIDLALDGQEVSISLEDVEVQSQDIEGWMVANSGALVVALDVNISEELEREGIAREIVNRVQNIRKNSGFDVTDKIAVKLEQKAKISSSVEEYRNYICTETLANELTLVSSLENVTETLEILGEEINVQVTKA